MSTWYDWYINTPRQGVYVWEMVKPASQHSRVHIHRRASQLCGCRQGVTIVQRSPKLGTYSCKCGLKAKKYNLIYWNEMFCEKQFTYKMLLVNLCCYVFHLCAQSLTSAVTVANVMFIYVYLCCVCCTVVYFLLLCIARPSSLSWLVYLPLSKNVNNMLSTS